MAEQLSEKQQLAVAHFRPYLGRRAKLMTRYAGTLPLIAAALGAATGPYALFLEPELILKYLDANATAVVGMVMMTRVHMERAAEGKALPDERLNRLMFYAMQVVYDMLCVVQAIVFSQPIPPVSTLHAEAKAPSRPASPETTSSVWSQSESVGA